MHRPFLGVFFLDIGLLLRASMVAAGSHPLVPAEWSSSFPLRRHGRTLSVAVS
ncbi:hypothetical protein Ae331Ps2_5942 [Pseudonocardia sp. Ae331_Ps2]|nr:hypothetical protein Ae331Ps2_5931 [Pseudonocardia sp. Ae331_Ps2]OLL89601.1 hypothetical protein Ae331Ps2_5935 [Pseudonocardia sp. Ae331_Ps2]OLL89603.1 hypothetical protein Ae331Ps2_5937 [Pseudonocardia sp. Ae331_Ps2]OLL89608.1 hypothetical protein Ae331Ps2_5942 [Pseudonocardia sp. Ae331_Ps2]